MNGAVVEFRSLYEARLDSFIHIRQYVVGI